MSAAAFCTPLVFRVSAARTAVAVFLSLATAFSATAASPAAKPPLCRTLDATGFHTEHGERFWSRPLYGPNRRSFVLTGELPHAAFLWEEPQERAFVRCGQLLPGVISPQGGKWLYRADDVTATYDPGMMRFVVRDPAMKGELQIELVPLAPGDGYAMRIVSTQPVELAFAFGGFLCLPAKEPYEGVNEFPGGIVAEACRDQQFAVLNAKTAIATLKNVVGSKQESLVQTLDVVLLTDRPTQVSLHEARSGIALDELLRLPAAEKSPATVQVHRIKLAAGEPLNIVVAIPEKDKTQATIAELAGKTAETFDSCVRRMHEIAGRIRLTTPDTLIDLGARSLSVSMDALWTPPVFMHGPICWGRAGLAGWRMAYGADVCGNYDRVGSHCKFYGDHQSQGGLDRKPRLDPAAELTRQAPDSLLFSQGAVVNWGMYNMTGMWLSFIAHHDDWTGDDEYLRTMWPAIRDAVAFQKRTMDMDGDNLYENYANTYISDAHWHNGGDCTQESAYMYSGNLLAARAARLAGQSPQPYLDEAARIRAAMNRVLWVKEKGVFAEWKDTLGKKLLHTDPELGSVYLPIDYGVADRFQAYQMLRFTEWGLPNYVFEERGRQPFDGIYRAGSTYEFPQPMNAREIKSSNWRPIICTVRECSPGEMMDTARAYYRLGYGDRAFPLVKAVLRCMVNLTTVGGLVIQDRNGEQPGRSWGNYNIDHCDTLGSSLQCLAEGLFGIHPHMPEKLLEIQPGFPSDWDHAQIELHDFGYSFRRQGDTDTYRVTSSRPTKKLLRLVMRGDGVEKATVNGKPAQPRFVAGIGHAFVEMDAPEGLAAEFVVVHSDKRLPRTLCVVPVARGEECTVICNDGEIVDWSDPQGIFERSQITGERRRFTARALFETEEEKHRAEHNLFLATVKAAWDSTPRLLGCGAHRPSSGNQSTLIFVRRLKSSAPSFPPTRPR